MQFLWVLSIQAFKNKRAKREILLLPLRGIPLAGGCIQQSHI